MPIPEKELDFFINAIRKKPEYLDPTYIKGLYQKLGLNVISNPFSNKVPQLIIKALKEREPFSVIRIGDGEANLLSFSSYPETPTLNLKAAKKIISMQQDSFSPSYNEIINLQHRIYQAIQTADIVGVIGLWRPQKRKTSELIDAFLKSYRGINGHWKAIDHLITLARQGHLKEKTLASAHLYFSILENISDILASTDKVLLITNRSTILQKFNSIISEPEYILVGENTGDNKSTPDFLYTVKKQLPTNMSGYLCLIGAGPWSEIYCHWVKKRGGVAVDLGSGFDLLDNETSRPIHKILKLDSINRYTL